MIKYLKLLIFVVTVLLPQITRADEITFAWDYGDTSAIDGFKLYSGPRGIDETGEWVNKYRPEPLAEVAADQLTATVTEPGIAGESRNICFVVRSYRGDRESTDSNYVCQIIDNTPLSAPAGLTGMYDVSGSIVTLNWTQADAERAKFWLIYYKLPDGDFTELGRVDNTGQTDVTVSSVFRALLDGQQADVTFAVVAYKNFDVYSPNSDEIIVHIDRSQMTPPAPTGFRISARIVVE
jgi:hypothetical protein